MKNTELKKQVAEALQNEREKKGLTRRQASASASMDENAYRRIEQGNINVTVDTIERLFKVFGKKVRLLITDIYQQHNNGR